MTTLVGAPRVLGALIPLAKAEADMQQSTPASLAELSTRSARYDLDTMNMLQINERGTHTINTIYGPLLPKIFSAFGSHRGDAEVMEVALIYGLYLSEHTLLSPIETEVVAHARTGSLTRRPRNR